MLQEKIDFLRTLRIFAALNDQQLERVALICQAWEFEDGAVIAYQRDVADSLYIVVEGLLVSYVMAHGQEARHQVFEPGAYFDEQWLFGEDVHPATIRAESDGRLYTIREEDFELFIEDYPNAILDMPDSVWDELDHTRSSPAAPSVYRRLELLPGEQVLYESHRTALLLITGLFGPLLLALGGLAAAWGIGILLPTITAIWSLVLAAVLMLPGILFALWRFLDWKNDYLLLTNYHLVHREFELTTFQSGIIKIPLDQIQSISVLRESLVQSLLGVGTVRVTTAAQSDGLRFRLIQNPDEAEQALNEARQRTERLDRSRERVAVRGAIERHFEVPDEIVPFEESEAIVAGQAGLPDTRVDPGRKTGFQTITYRRHWIVLLRATFIPVMVMLTVAAVAAFLAATLVSLLVPIIAVAGVILLGVFFWFFYNYLDWKNDLYQLTSAMVIDIDRLPFRLDEDRKTADLKNVQNVQVSRPNIVATLFGFGDVTIDTAGASAEIIFEDVADPNRVQSDIFARRNQVLRSGRMTDAVDRRQEMLLMLDEYHQLREQRKIPRMTPHLELEEDQRRFRRDHRDRDLD